MPTEPKSVFLIVRSHAYLERANKEAAAYLSILRGRSPAGAFGTLQGIWIDEKGIVNLPPALELPKSGDETPIDHMVGAIGVNGIWMLCWLETAIDKVSRVDLVAALLGQTGQEKVDSTPAHFIPVVAEGEPDLRVSDELQTLEARYPRLVQPPIRRSARDSLLRLWSPPNHQVAPA